MLEVREPGRRLRRAPGPLGRLGPGRRRARSWPSSGRTAPARRRSCAHRRAVRPRAGRVLWKGEDLGGLAGAPGRRARRGDGARGPAALRPHDGRGEPLARRVQPAGATASGRRASTRVYADLPAPGRASPPARGRAVGRRAADGRHRAGAHDPAAASSCSTSRRSGSRRGSSRRCCRCSERSTAPAWRSSSSSRTSGPRSASRTVPTCSSTVGWWARAAATDILADPEVRRAYLGPLAVER